MEREPGGPGTGPSAPTGRSTRRSPT